MNNIFISTDISEIVFISEILHPFANIIVFEIYADVRSLISSMRMIYHGGFRLHKILT